MITPSPLKQSNLGSSYHHANALLHQSIIITNITSMEKRTTDQSLCGGVFNVWHSSSLCCRSPTPQRTRHLGPAVEIHLGPVWFVLSAPSIILSSVRPPATCSTPSSCPHLRFFLILRDIRLQALPGSAWAAPSSTARRPACSDRLLHHVDALDIPGVDGTGVIDNRCYGLPPCRPC